MRPAQSIIAGLTVDADGNTVIPVVATSTRLTAGAFTETKAMALLK